MNAKAYPMFFTRLVPLPELWNEMHIESEGAPHDFNDPKEVMKIHHDAFVDWYSVGDSAV